MMSIKFDELHAETQVRFVASILFHGIVPSDTHKRLLDIDTTDHLEQMLAIPSNIFSTSSCSTKLISQSICVNSAGGPHANPRHGNISRSGNNGRNRKPSTIASTSAETEAKRRTVRGSYGEGTTKSRAPSGVEFTSTGVSTSRKPCSSK